eukprot:299052_1
MSRLLLLLFTAFYHLCNGDTWFVSQDGSDQNHCNDTSIPCSSIFWALLVANAYDTTNEPEIYVFGQNLILSKEIAGDVPICTIPTNALLMSIVTITFDPNITSLDDWYDVTFCEREGNSGEYLMVHISSTLILNNFIWNNYEFNNNKGHVSRIYGGCLVMTGFPIADDVTFNNCKFSNIIVNNTYDEDSLPPGANGIIHGQKLTFNDCEFVNISIYSSTTFAEFSTISFIANEEICSETQQNDQHELIFTNSIFDNILFKGCQAMK